MLVTLEEVSLLPLAEKLAVFMKIARVDKQVRSHVRMLLSEPRPTRRPIPT